MVAPSLRIPLSLNMDTFKKSVSDAKSATSEATQFIVKKFVDMNASVLATSGTAGAAALGLRSLLGTLTFVAGGIAAVEAAFKLMSYATDLAKEKIEEFNDIAEKAGQAGVSNDFFQRFIKGGEQVKLSIDDATEALDTFAQKTKESLGGSEVQQRIDELVKAGNFSGNTGVAAFGASADTQQRLQAIVSLIDQAVQSGQRLAGLDIANKAFGPTIADNLRADAGFLDKMLASAQSISQSKIIDDAQIGQAVDLKNRLEEAQKILAERWKPVQDDLAKLGMNYQQSWVEIYESIAVAVGYATQLYDAIKKIPDVLAQAGSSSFWTKLTEYSGSLGLNSDPASLGITLKGQPGFGNTDIGSPAFNALRAGLQNPAAVQKAMLDATSVESKVRGDTSKAPKATNDAADAYDRAQESVTKLTARLQAEADAQGKGTQALEEFKAEAQLTAAALQAGLDPTSAKISDRIQDLAQDAGDAAQALEKAKVANNISRGQQTSLLSPEDVQIANQLKGLYPDVATALGSVEATALRTNQALSGVSSEISSDLTTGLTDIATGAKTASQSFSDMASSIVRSIEQMVIKLTIVQPLMQALQGAFGGGFNILTGSANPIAGISGHADGGLISGPGGPRSDNILTRVSPGEFIVNAASTAQHRQLLEAINSGNIRGFVDGGIVGMPSIAAPVAGGRSGGIVVNLVEDASRAGQTQKNDDGSGGFDLTIFVDSITAKNAANPGSATSQVLNQRGRLASR